MSILSALQHKLDDINPLGRSAAYALLAGCLVFGLAFILPFAVSESSVNELSVSELANNSNIGTISPQALAKFRSMSRWGVSIEESVGQAAKDLSVNDNGIIAYRGLIENAKQVVVLQLPDGTYQRFNIGDTLPDGRVIQQINPNNIRITSDSREETLLLFPVIKPEG